MIKALSPVSLAASAALAMAMFASPPRFGRRRAGRGDRGRAP